jgi:photosystem II stability/assembly factor-like uncharacterized protein
MKSRFILFAVFVACTAVFINEAIAQWYKIPDLQYSRIWCILTANDSTIFVGADNGTLLRSTDDGTTWMNVVGNGLYVDTVLSLGEGLGYIFAGSNGWVYRSSDDGESWDLANDGLEGISRVNAFTFVDTILFTATDHGVYSSIDSGKSWFPDTSGLNLWEFDQAGTVGITSMDSSLYTIKGWYGSVYTSSVDNRFWTQILPDTMNQGYAIAAIDTNVFIVTLKGVYLYSGGSTTWYARNNGFPVNDTIFVISCFLTTADSLLFAYSDFSDAFHGGHIYVTSDLGQTWIMINDSVSAHSTITAVAANSKYLFAGTQSGAWRIPVADVITSVNDNHPQLPTVRSLFQNYPNPFNPTTVISYRLSAISNVTLKVYDVLGREVETLVNEKQYAGTHVVTFNASDLSSGVYFYKLSAGNYTSTKKALLVK